VLHDVSAWTWFWGVWGAAFFGRSLVGGDVIGVRYGAVMLGTWFVATLSFLCLDAETAMLPIVAVDGSAALLTAVYLSDDGNVRGWWMLGLFALEMIVRVAAWRFDVWNTNPCYSVLNVIYGMGVAVAGSRCVLESIYDGWGRITAGVGAYRRRG
jgi:hypothetical protein